MWYPKVITSLLPLDPKLSKHDIINQNKPQEVIKTHCVYLESKNGNSHCNLLAERVVYTLEKQNLSEVCFLWGKWRKR